MEGLEMSNGKVDAEEEQIKREKKAKSKTKAKKSKKASKRAPACAVVKILVC